MRVTHTRICRADCAVSKCATHFHSHCAINDHHNSTTNLHTFLATTYTLYETYYRDLSSHHRITRQKRGPLICINYDTALPERIVISRHRPIDHIRRRFPRSARQMFACFLCVCVWTIVYCIYIYCTFKRLAIAYQRAAEAAVSTAPDCSVQMA